MNYGKTYSRRFGFYRTPIIVGVFCVVTIVALWWAFNPKGPGRISQVVAVEPPTYNFGTVFQAQIIRHSFSLVNRSDRALRVVGVKSTCSCTTVGSDLLGRIISPQERLPVPVEYSVGEREGPVSSFVSVFVATTNEAKKLYEVQAHMEGDSMPEFTIHPNTIDFGSLKPGEQASRTVVFTPMSVRNLKISEPKSSVEAFHVSLEQKETPTDSPSTVVISFQAPTNMTRQQALSETIQFKTSSPRVPKASIYVIGRVVPDVEIIPDTIFVPSSGLSKEGQTELTIRTSALSQVTRLAAKSTLADTRSLEQPVAEDAGNKVHHLRIPNALLEDAVGLDVELKVHDERDRVEVRSVFVSIKNLNSKRQP